MSRAYICDITQEVVSQDDGPTKTVMDKNTTINGVDVNVKVNIVVDAFNNSKETNISETAWVTIIAGVKNYLGV